MVKPVDLAVYQAMMAANKGAWKPGIRLLGLAEGGVDYSLDKYNKNLITDAMKARVEAAKADIISSKLKVTNYVDIMDK